MQQQVVEIGGVRGGQLGLVSRIDPLDDGSQRVARPRLVLLGRDQVVLGPTDGPGDGLGRDEGGVDLQLGHDAAEGLEAVAGVVDRVVLLQADQRGVFPQQPGAEAVERADPDRPARGQPLHPAAHLLGRLVGEGQGEDLLVGDAFGQQPGDAVGDHPGLSAARPGQDQQRPFEVQHGLALGVGQSFEEVGPSEGSCRDLGIWGLVGKLRTGCGHGIAVYPGRMSAG